MKKLNAVISKLFTKSLLHLVLELKKRGLLPGFIPKLFLGYDYQSLKFENIEKYSLIHKQKVSILYNLSTVLSYAHPKSDGVKSENYSMHSIEVNKNYAAILRDVEISGGSNVIILDSSSALYDFKNHDISNKMYFSDFGIRYYSKDYLLIKTFYSASEIESGIFMGGNFSFNYFHLLYEIIIKFQQINKMNIDLNIPLLVDKIILDVPQYSQLLSLLNINNRKLIPIEKGYRYKVKQLYHISCANIIPPDLINPNSVVPADVLFDLNAIEYLRNHLLSFSSNKDFPKRIFISRNKASGRRAFNEEEVFKVFESYNFTKVFPEDYSLIDQIALFNNADFIAGGSGAAFTNLLFCKKNAKIIIFVKNSLTFLGWWTIVKHVGADMFLITEEIKEDQNIKGTHDSYTIDTKKLDLLVSDLV